MAKAKQANGAEKSEAPAEAVKSKPPETVAHYLTEAMKALGEEGSKPKAVVQWVKDKYPQYEWSDSSLTQGCTKVRQALGFKSLRGGDDSTPTARKATPAATTPVASAEPTLTDMMAAQDTLHTLGYTAPKLHELVKELRKVGSLDTLEKCLEGIVKIQAGGAKPK